VDAGAAAELVTRTAAAAGVVVAAVAAVALGVTLAGGSRGTPSALDPPAAVNLRSAPVIFDAAASAISTPATVIGSGGVVEHSFRWASSAYRNAWEQVRLTMQLTSPAGSRYQIGGFYYATNTWKARFSPSELGHWTWRAQLTDGTRTADYRGAFTVLRSKNPGFVRVSRYNRFRFSFANGSPYYPLGIGDCVVDTLKSGSPLDHWGLDGGFRPPGIHTDGRQVSMNAYMRAYQGAGVNLFRWSVNNCSFPIYQTIDPNGNVYLAQAGIWGDQLVQRMRSHGFRIYMTIFNQPPFAENPSGAQLAAVERYVKYVVDRWGPYVDFWELMNESTASDSWYQQVAGYLHRIDPYHHLISTSYERPDLPEIAISSPHWYENESQFDSDSDTWGRMTTWERAGKPVVVGEQGNAARSWYPDSALRMRLRAWTAFFAQGTLIFWNASFAKDDVGNAIYLGPQERGYIRVLQRFTGGFDPRASIARVSVSDPAAVRGYALRGPRDYAAYLVAYTNHTSQTRGVRVSVAPRSTGTAVWIDPASGAILDRTHVRAGSQSLAVPPFVTDIALKIGR
jgi:hypothetical protein